MLQVEALQLWRCCAEHSISLMHLDDSYAPICRLFDYPSSSSDLNQASSTATEAHAAVSQNGSTEMSHVRTAPASKAEQILQKAQLHASCQAYLLLGTLVRHATRQGDLVLASSLFACGASCDCAALHTSTEAVNACRCE